MAVLKFKYVGFSFPFMYLPIGSDYMILMLTSIEYLQRKAVYCPPLAKYKILEIFTTN